MYVGVDVGGTKVLAVALDREGAVNSTASVPTPGRLSSVPALEDALTAAVESLGQAPQAVGVSAAGLVDADGETVRFATHLPWRESPARSSLEDRWGVPVVLDNDATCAGVAELARGSASGASSALVITLGTGIGGAVILGGRIYRGHNGMAGEFGHQQVVPEGLACECGQRGCWEQYCSGNALERLVRVSLGAHLDGPEVTARAQAGDPIALAAFSSIGTWLGVGVANLVDAFDPEVVVIGGGLSAVGDLLLEPARATLARRVIGAGHRDLPTLVPATFGPESGAVGAALLAGERVRAG